MHKNYYENLPQNWCIERLGNLLVIERGGSPRPINMYLTNENGVNWIKISDSIKGSKYITQSKEKIISEGIKYSRFVNKGDFILSNSMSFGRPYILKIDGCIHDGWLVIREPDKCFYIDFLFYALSSNYVFKQFCESASGAVVSNLNIDKVKNTLIYIPPITEQIKIANMLENIFAILN